MSDSTTSPPGTPTPTDVSLGALIAAWADRGRDRDHAAVLAALVARVAAARGLEVPFLIDGREIRPDTAMDDLDVDPAVVDAWGPWMPGLLREALLGGRARSAAGVHHTAPAVVDAVLDTAGLVRRFGPDDVVVDPAVGGGAFLLAVAARLPGERASIVRRLRGVDTDPLAVAVTRAALGLWSGGVVSAPDAIRVGDGLSEAWDEEIAWVVGNPPFLSQLKGDTVRGRDRHAALRARWPELGAYADDAAAFLLAATETVGPGGVVALVQPASVLSTRDTAAVRSCLHALAPPVAIWLDDGQRFDAAVDTVAIVLQRGADSGRVHRRTGVPPVAAPPGVAGAGSWAALLIDDGGALLADDEFAGGRTVGDVAAVTAGFRDEFYGLRGAVRDDPDGEFQLVTSGLIDPLENRWGAAPCRFDRQRWTHPAVDLAAVAPTIAAWVRDRLRPKLVLASQTKTIEVVVDEDGTIVPCTPVVSVEPMAGAPSLDHLAAALTSPVAAALLYREAAGSALSRDAMRVRAASVAALPLPDDSPAWDRAAALVAARRAGEAEVSLAAIGRAAMAAYGVEDRADLHTWWHSRLPRR